MSGHTSAMEGTQSKNDITIALCGDVMLGRGIDQIMRWPGNPILHEPSARSAQIYVKLAEDAYGRLPRTVAADYVWGDALPVLRSEADLRLINLETSLTESRRYLPKGINYKMSPRNADCLAAARISCCFLANNHVLDWGPAGLIETLATLEKMGIHHVGAGRSAAEAERPLALPLPGGARLIVLACGASSAGVPRSWAAGPGRPGVHYLPDLSAASVTRLADAVRRLRRPGDHALISLHWGPNWGYEIPQAFRDFAHGLIDRAEFDVVFGHSSHHAKGIEVYRSRLIIYGAGDFLNDYEGITGYEAYRGDLVALYLATLSRATGQLDALEIVPFRIRKFRLNAMPEVDARWFADTLDRESRPLGCRVTPNSRGRLTVDW